MKEYSKKKIIELGKDISLYGFMAAIAKLSGFILLPIFTRTFSTDQYGIIDISTVLKSLLSAFVCLSLPNAVRRFFIEEMKEKNQKAFISYMLFCVLILSIVLGIVCYLIRTPASEYILKQQGFELLFFIICISSIFDGLARVPQMVLRMERRIIFFNGINLFYSFSYMFLSLYFVFVLNKNIYGVMAAMLIADFSKLAIGLWGIKDFISFEFLEGKIIRSLTFSLPILPADILNWVNAQVDRILILALIGLSGVGVFGAASRVAILVKLPNMIFQQAWAPYSMTLLDSPANERNEFYKKILSYYSFLFLNACMLLTAVSPEVFELLLPAEYHKGYILIPWLVGASVFELSRGITGVGVAISKKTYLTSISSIVSVLLNLTIGLLFIPRFGIAGAAIGSFISQFMFTGLLSIASIKFTDIPFRIQSIGLQLIVFVVGSIVLLVTIQQIKINSLSFIIRASVVCLSLLITYYIGFDKTEKLDICAGFNKLLLFFKK